MQQRISGTFNGTGAALYVCCGFEPDWVELVNLEDSTPIVVRWDYNARSAEQIDGLVLTNHADTQLSRLTVASGIQRYQGGDVFATDQTAYLAPLVSADMRSSGTGSTVNSWTMDTAGSLTGHFNAPVSTTYVGEGSLVCIDGVWTRIAALSNDGDAANDVTLSANLGDGVVHFIGPMVDYWGVKAGRVTPAGFKVTTTGEINTSGEMVLFTAGTNS